MGSRRCCSCETTPPERCEGCCSDCIAAHIIEVNGQSTFANQTYGDIFLLHQGIMTGEKMAEEPYPNEPEGLPAIKKEYVYLDSYWTWYHPAFMLNFDPHFPPCNNFGHYRGSDGYPAYGSLSDVGGDDRLGYGGLFKNPKSIQHLTSPVIISDYLFSTGYFNWHIPSGTHQTDLPKFSNIMAVDPYECRNSNDCPGDYDGCPASLNVYSNPSPNTVLPWNGGAVTLRSGYPCSTAEEDLCCGYGGWWNNTGSSQGPGSAALVGYERFLYNPYNSTPWGGNPGNAINSCNFLGLSKYHRRIQRTYFPWSWQVFSYALDHLIPFGNAFREWTQVQDEETGETSNVLSLFGANLPIGNSSPRDIIEPTGFAYYPMSYSSKEYNGGGPPAVGPGTVVPCADLSYAFTGQFASTLRQQFLGFAFCEHHYDYACGRSVVFEQEGGFIPASVLVPRRFVFSCSGIPMFQFDLFEAVQDDIITVDEAISLIRSWKSFTMWFENPENDNGNLNFLQRDLPSASLGIPEIKNTPTLEQVNEGRRILNLLSSGKFSGLRVKDWREEAYDEIIEANTIYRESIRDTYILRNYEDISRTAEQIKQDAEDHAKSTFDIGTALGFRPVDFLSTPEGKIQALSAIFPNQLGPIRKRCRQSGAAKRTSGKSEVLDDNQSLITKNSQQGFNVLTPKNIVPLIGQQRSVGIGDVQVNKFENWRVDRQFESYQSLYYADISKFLFKEDINFPNIERIDQPPNSAVGTENGKWNSAIYGSRYSEFDVHCDMVNRISHLCYTYFVAQPKGWDFVGWGPGSNGSKPENNWWFRRFGYIEIREGDPTTLYTNVRKHSEISGGCGGSSNISNWEYAWNPSGVIFKPCCEETDG